MGRIMGMSGWIALWLVAVGDAQEPARKTDIAFKVIAGDDNGSRAILEKRKADLLARRDGKLQSHDWWLWGLTPIDYDRDGDPDAFKHNPARSFVGWLRTVTLLRVLNDRRGNS